MSILFSSIQNTFNIIYSFSSSSSYRSGGYGDHGGSFFQHATRADDKLQSQERAEGAREAPNFLHIAGQTSLQTNFLLYAGVSEEQLNDPHPQQKHPKNNNKQNNTMLRNKQSTSTTTAKTKHSNVYRKQSKDFKQTLTGVHALLSLILTNHCCPSVCLKLSLLLM